MKEEEWALTFLYHAWQASLVIAAAVYLFAPSGAPFALVLATGTTLVRFAYAWRDWRRSEHSD